MKMKLCDFYSEKYDLEQLDLKISDNSVLFLIYDDDYYYYLKDNKFLTMEQETSVLKSIGKLNKDYLLKIINFYPVCFCKDTLVIALRTERVDNSKLKPVQYNKMDTRYKKLIDYHKCNYATFFVSSNVKNEISMSIKNVRRYKLHEDYIKKYILTDKKRKKAEFNDLLDKIIPNKKTIIDVSCGDNSDLFRIAKRKDYTTIVGNDICLNYLNTQDNDYVVYTNDDVELNNIAANSYDVSFCKNTLHHMNNLTNINNILNFLDKISNEIIIVEIANPQESKGLPKFLNKYLYTKFLKDVGNCYLNEEQFKTIIDNKFKKHKIKYLNFTNILGTYMIAVIKKEGV